MKRAVAHFPDARIGAAPNRTHVIRDAREDGPGVTVDTVPAFAVQPRGFEQRAVDVELALLERAVADAHGPRAAVTCQGQIALAGPDAAVEPVQDMKLRLGERARLHEPPEQRSRFVIAVQLEQRIDDEVRIANPAEAIVPVALAANLL